MRAYDTIETWTEWHLEQPKLSKSCVSKQTTRIIKLLGRGVEYSSIPRIIFYLFPICNYPMSPIVLVMVVVVS